MSRLDWALWPEARASCIVDDEVDCGVPSAPRSGPGCDAWCVSSRDRCSRPVAWHRPPPEPCHGSAPSADDRARPGVQPHPKPAPAWADPLWNGWLHMAIQRGPRHTESATGDCLTNALAQLQSGAHQLSSSIWMFGIGLPNNAATFF